jgi:hypothetical protein
MSSISTTDGGYQYYQRKLSDLESDMKDEARRARESYEERTDEVERKSQQSKLDLEKKTEQTVDNIRDNASEHAQKERDAARAEVERAKSSFYDKSGRVHSDAAYQQKRADEAIRQAQQELESQKAKLQRANESTADRIALAAADRMTKNADLERESRIRESAELRDSLHSMMDFERTYAKEKGQGSADARRELEDAARSHVSTLQRQFETELQQLNQKNKQAEQDLARTAQENRLERDRQFAQTIHNMTQQHQDDQRILNDSTEHTINQVRDMARQQAEHSQIAMDRQAATLAEDRQAALTHQAETFRREKQTQREDDDSRIHHLENEIKGHITSGDQNWVSPAAEAKMRDNFMREFTKKSDAEIKRDQERTDSIHKEYTRRLASTIEAADTRVANTEAERRSDEHLQRQTLMNHIQEVQETHEQMLRDKDYQSSRQAENINHTYSNSLERQRREYEGTINQLKADSNEKLTQLRQQHDFETKMSQRGSAMKQYELSKAYERKLEEQKIAYDDEIAKLKEQLATRGHEAERRTRQLLEDQAKGYEQKIAQMEYQTKERERTISDNYQDQIEKLKRSNALLIQRKS